MESFWILTKQEGVTLIPTNICTLLQTDNYAAFGDSVVTGRMLILMFTISAKALKALDVNVAVFNTLQDI